MADLVIQRFVLPRDLTVASLYYREQGNPDPARRGSVRPLDRRSIVIGCGAGIDTDTYFNSFFELHWRRHTTLGRLVLRLRVSGVGTVHLWRTSNLWGRSAVNGSVMVGQSDFDGEDVEVEVNTPGPAFHFAQMGTLYFEVIARSSPVTLHGAEWVAKDAQAARVELVAGYCTCNRPTYLLDNLEALAADRELWSRLTRVVVVDQGTQKVRTHAGFSRLSEQAIAGASFVEQANFGGSGGFTRCILEAMQVPGATHMLLLDDDAVMEPESVYRTCTMLSLARGDLAIGGPMLDMVRSSEISEAGADLDPIALRVKSHHLALQVDDRRSIRRLAHVHYAQYNAWWFFAFPLSAVDRVGLPLPLFIKCDDIEYGIRLMRAGIPTLAMPGLGVWHQPCYLKNRGWDEYYGLRNMLITQAVCATVPGRQVARRLVIDLLNRLLTCNYFRGWVLCEAVEDYLAGPSVLEQEPQPIWDRINQVWRRMSPLRCSRTCCVRRRRADAVPKSRVRRWVRLTGAMVRQVVWPSPPPGASPAFAFGYRDENWHAMRSADVLAIDEPWSEDLVILRRDRGLFLRLLARGMWVIARLLLSHGRTVLKWKAETRRFAGLSFWRRYLGLGPQESPRAEAVSEQVAEPV